MNTHCLLTIVGGKLLPIRHEIVAHRRSLCDACGVRCVFWGGLETRPLPWMKIKAIQDALEHCVRVLWMDADATPRMRFRFPRAFPRADVVAVRDQNGLNTGLLLLENTNVTRRLLRVTWTRTEFLNHPWWEQEAMRRSLFDGSMSRNAVRLTTDTSRYVDHIAGCLSTQPASVCRAHLRAAIRTSRNATCQTVRLHTVPLRERDIRPKP
jgi:hypothetical protein